MLGSIAITVIWIIVKEHSAALEYTEVDYAFHCDILGSQARFFEYTSHEFEAFSVLMVIGPGLIGLGLLLGRKQFRIQHILWVILLAGVAGSIPSFLKPPKRHTFYSYVGGFDSSRKLKCVRTLSVEAIAASPRIKGIVPPTLQELKKMCYEPDNEDPADTTGPGPGFVMYDTPLLTVTRQKEVIDFMKIYFLNLVNELAKEKGLPPITSMPEHFEMVVPFRKK